jgi:hypothetical protein
MLHRWHSASLVDSWGAARTILGWWGTTPDHEEDRVGVRLVVVAGSGRNRVCDATLTSPLRASSAATSLTVDGIVRHSCATCCRRLTVDNRRTSSRNAARAMRVAHVNCHPIDRCTVTSFVTCAQERAGVACGHTRRRASSATHGGDVALRRLAPLVGICHCLYRSGVGRRSHL